jgi:hypothetical protein
MIVFVGPYTVHSQLGTTCNYSAIADLRTVQFTVTHALWFSVFTSILATDLQQSHCHFKSHIKSSSHSLVPFLPLFCSCQLSSVPSSQAHLPAGWSLELDSLLDSTTTLFWRTLPYNHLHGTRRKHSVCCTDPLPSSVRPIARVCFRGNVFTESLPSSRSIRHNIKIGLQEVGFYDASGEGVGSLALICEHSNKCSGSIEGEELICQIRDCQLSNKSEDSVLWSSSVLVLVNI